MKPSKDILNELQAIAPALALLDKKNFYQVSNGYFEDSSVKIIELLEDDKVHAANPVLASMKKTEFYNAPEGYFASFTDSIIYQIHADEVIQELSYTAPHLAGLDKKELYAVPANYFAVFPMMVSSLAAQEAEAHDSAIEHEMSRWSLWVEKAYSIILRPRYSFALACIVATGVLVSVVLTHSTLTPEEKIFAQMQQIPDNELHHYLSRHRDDFDERTILYHINDIDFTHYFDKPENVPAHLKGNIKMIPDNFDNINEDIID